MYRHMLSGLSCLCIPELDEPEVDGSDLRFIYIIMHICDHREVNLPFLSFLPLLPSIPACWNIPQSRIEILDNILMFQDCQFTCFFFCSLVVLSVIRYAFMYKYLSIVVYEIHITNMLGTSISLRAKSCLSVARCT